MFKDLDVFFSDFGVDATLAGVAVRGIFDNGHALGGVGLGGMADTQPAFVLPSNSFTGDPVGQTLVVNTASYYVSAHEPDGTGMSRLILEVA